MINITGKVARQKTIAELIRMQIIFERPLIRRVPPILTRQAKAAAKVYKESGDAFAADAAILSFTPAWKQLLQPHIQRVGVTFGNRIFSAFKHDASLHEYKDEQTVFLDSLQKWVIEQGARDVKRINQTTRELLQSAILSGQQEGEGQDGIAKIIVDKIVGTGRLTAQVRARTIARTETHNAMTFAGDEAAKSTGLQLEREWLSAEDDRTRSAHAEVDGQKREMDKPFDVGGAKLMRPGDPDGAAEQVINCRCGVIYQTL